MEENKKTNIIIIILIIVVLIIGIIIGKIISFNNNGSNKNEDNTKYPIIEVTDEKVDLSSLNYEENDQWGHSYITYSLLEQQDGYSPDNLIVDIINDGKAISIKDEDTNKNYLINNFPGKVSKYYYGKLAMDSSFSILLFIMDDGNLYYTITPEILDDMSLTDDAINNLKKVEGVDNIKDIYYATCTQYYSSEEIYGNYTMVARDKNNKLYDIKNYASVEKYLES